VLDHEVEVPSGFEYAGSSAIFGVLFTTSGA